MNSSTHKMKSGSERARDMGRDATTHRESHKINPPSGQQTLCQVQPFSLMSQSSMASS